MVQLNQLVEFSKAGLLKIKYTKGESVAVLNNKMKLSVEDATRLCTNFGWVEYVLSPFEIIDKTARFIRGFKKEICDTEPIIAQNISLEFHNKYTGVMDGTFDRIIVAYRNNPVYAINYGMPGSGAAYVIYNLSTSVPLRRCRNLKQVALELVGLIG